VLRLHLHDHKSINQQDLARSIQVTLALKIFLLQDDAHIFCTPEQIAPEIQQLLGLVEDILGKFGFSQFEVNLSTRPEDSIGSDEVWESAEVALSQALNAKGWKYTVDEGGGAFYGPKIDIKIQASLQFIRQLLQPFKFQRATRCQHSALHIPQ
jgi:hypothetical protein